MQKHFPLLRQAAVDELESVLLFFNIAELRDSCRQLGLPDCGKKKSLVARVITFIQTGEILSDPTIPIASRAEKGQKRCLAPEAKMLFGLFKNDAMTREFFKKLIGQHFHYTAFGLDWLQERWLSGNPPTYQEFALFWQQEYTLRKRQPAALKPEWALLNFVKDYVQHYPEASRDQVCAAWKIERLFQVKKGMNILRPLFSR